MNKIFRKAIVLALAGSALLYVGCTKDYSGDIQTLRKDLEEYKTATNGQLNTLNGQVSQLQQSVSALESAKEKTDQAIQDLKNRAEALETFRKNAENRFNGLDSQISGINGQLSSINGEISGINGHLAGIDGQINGINGQITGINGQLNQINSDITDINVQLLGVNDQFVVVDGQIAAINSDISALQAADEQLLEAINAAKDRIKALEENTYTKEEVDGMIQDINGTISAAMNWVSETFATKEALSEVDGKIGTLSGVVDAIDARLTDVETILSALQDFIDAMDARLIAVENGLSDLGNRVQTLESTVEAQGKDIEALKKADANILETIEGIKNDIRDLKAMDQQILGEIDAIKDDINNLTQVLADVKTTAETALDKANQALSETEAIRNDLKANYYTAAQVDAMLQTLREGLEAQINTEIEARKKAVDEVNARIDQEIKDRIDGDDAANARIDAEIAAREAADKAANERIDSLAKVTKDLQEDLDSYKIETNQRLLDLEAALNMEIALRAAFQEAQEAKNKEFEDADKALQAAIAAVDQAYKEADAALNNRCAALEGRCKGLEDRMDVVEPKLNALRDEFDNFKASTETELLNLRSDIKKLRDDLNQEISDREAAVAQEKADREAAITGVLNKLDEACEELRGEIAAVQQKLDEFKASVEEELKSVWKSISNTNNRIDAIAERIQSVVFVPRYDDFAADAHELWLPQGRIQTQVRGIFEVKPASSVDYLKQLVDNGQVQVAVRELKSRADLDYVVNDVEVRLLDESRGRFEIYAYVGPEVGVYADEDEPFAISLILGDFTALTVVPNEEEGTAVDYNAGNSIQSTYVPVAGVRDGKTTPTFIWYDLVNDEPSNLGVAQDRSAELGVVLRVPYTKPAVNFPIYTALPEDFDYNAYPDPEKEYPYPDGVELFIQVEDVPMPIDIFALAMHVNPAVITPTVLAENFTFDAEGQEQDELVPFEYAGGIAPATTITTAAPEGASLKDYVKWFGTHRESFGFYNDEEVFLPVDVYAYAKTIITKNQVPHFISNIYEIPWSYQHPEAVENKVFEITEADGQLYAAVQGVQMNDDENPVNYTRKEGEEYETFPCPNSEDVSFEGNEIFFDKWIFEASDVDYKAGKILFETESDEYDFDVPFVVKKIASDRDVKIDLGEISYTPTKGYSSLISVISEGFKAHETEQEDYFIGDAVVAVNEGDDEHQVQLDSLYSKFIQEEPGNFQISSITVDGVDRNGFDGFAFRFAYDIENHADVSTFALSPAALGFGKTVVVKGTWTAWGVQFNYQFSFTTPEVPFFLVLTPYKDFDPSKSNTIIVEGDDVTDPDLYTLEQMYYTKYMRVQDQEGVPTNFDENLEVRFSFGYENFEEFGLAELAETDEAAAIAERGVVGGVVDVVEVLDGADAGYLDKQAILTWGSYNGLLVTATATLYDNGVPVSEPLEFYIQTMQPVKLIQAGTIGTATDPLIRISGNELEVNVAADMVIAGVLSRNPETNEAWYVDPAEYGVYDYKHNNINRATGEVCTFYGLEVEYDWDNITAKLNDVDWTLHEGTDFTAQGNIFTLIADNAKGKIEIKVPVRIMYYLDYCHVRAVDAGVVTINVRQI